VQLGLEQLLVGQARLVFRHERGRECPAQGVLHHFLVLRGAKQDADGGAFVWFAHVAVERFEVELQFAQMLGLKLVDLELDGHEAVEPPVEEEQIQLKVAPADLQRILAADEAEVAPQLDEEALQVLDQSQVQIRLGMRGGEVEEFDEVGVLEEGGRARMQIAQRW
jgi:hypothetical protein